VATKLKNKKHHGHRHMAQAKAHPYRHHAWTDEQMGDTHTNEYETETQKQLNTPRTDNYQFKVEQNWNNYPMGSFERTRSHAQIDKQRREPSGNCPVGESCLVPYSQREHAWSPDQHANSHSGEFHEETAFEATQGVASNPGGY
jgi:hypothetical protein